MSQAIKDSQLVYGNYMVHNLSSSTLDKDKTDIHWNHVEDCLRYDIYIKIYTIISMVVIYDFAQFIAFFMNKWHI